MSDAAIKLITGRSHPDLAKHVASELNTELCAIRLNNFANGEISCRIDESVRGKDVFVLQTHARNVNDSLMEQAIIIDAARRASAKTITAICPFMSYARQDRKSSGREPITSRLVTDILVNAGADRLMSIDLHAGQIQGFFNGPFDHLMAMPLLIEWVKNNLDTTKIVIVSPDAGRAKTAERYSRTLGCDMAIVHKQRSYEKHNSVEAKYLIGNITGKTCIVIDDMVDTAGTICAAADLLQEHGAAEIYGLTTHAILSDPAIKRIHKSAFKKIIATDTLPPLQNCSKLQILSIAPLLAQAITAVQTGDSLSKLFE